MPTVSVIIPTCNRAGLVRRALASIMDQTRQADEIIVVDDGSTDDTVAVLERDFPKVRLLKQSRSGVSSARNQGIRFARGEWIALLDSDDTWHREKLRCQLAALEATTGYLVCHTDEYWVRNGARVNPMEKHRKRGGYIFRHCLPRCAMSPSSILIHRQVFEAVGMFDEKLPACEDYDLWLRICASYPVFFVDRKLVTKYGGHADQLSRRYACMDRFRIWSLARLLEKQELSFRDREAAIDTLLNKIRIYLNGAEKRGNRICVAEFRKLRDSYSETARR